MNKDPALDAFDNRNKLEVRDVAEAIVTSIYILKKEAPSFQKLKKKLSKEDFAQLINTIIVTLVANIHMLTMSPDEVVKYAERLAESEHITMMGVAMLEKKYDA